MDTPLALTSYTREQLFALQPAASRVSRHLRKTLFQFRLWKPARERTQAAALRMGWPVRPPGSIVVSSRDPGSPEPAVLGLNINKSVDVGIKSDHRIIIGSFNAQSIRNKTASILDIISEQSLDIFSIVETWAKPEDIAIRAITPDGFVCVDRPRTQDWMFQEIVLRGAGVLLDRFSGLHFTIGSWISILILGLSNSLP